MAKGLDFNFGPRKIFRI